MKFVLTFCLCFINIVSFSQGFQIADSTKSWNTLFTRNTMYLTICDGTEILHLSDLSNPTDQYLDVLITMDTTNQEWEIIGQIREDALTRRIYFRTSETDTDGVLYDFSLEPGDTILVDNHWLLVDNQWYTGDINPMICDSVDYVNINGEQKKRIFLNRSDNPEYLAEIWIDGIGSTLGLMYSGSNSIAYEGGKIELLCCSQNDITIWTNTFFNECYINTFYPRFLSYTYDTAYLNTYYEYKMPVDTGNADSINLIGSYIPWGFSFDPATGILSGTPTELGMFDCEIIAKNLTYNFYTDLVWSYIPVVLPTGFNLPFNENFESGDFEANKWEIDGANWIINNEEGNQLPCAEFAASPAGINYSQSITSRLLEAGAGYYDNYFYLEFDLKLNTLAIDSTEKLYVDLFDGTEWINLAVYKNKESFNWSSEFLDFTDSLKGRLFNIRFRTEGMNTSNIENWLIDNIHLYRQHYPNSAKNHDVGLGSIFPNPTNNLFTIDVKSEVSIIEVFDLHGERIYTLKTNNRTTQIPINVKTWTKGIYMVRFTSKTGSSLAKKLVVN